MLLRKQNSGIVYATRSSEDASDLVLPTAGLPCSGEADPRKANGSLPAAQELAAPTEDSHCLVPSQRGGGGLALIGADLDVPVSSAEALVGHWSVHQIRREQRFGGGMQCWILDFHLVHSSTAILWPLTLSVQIDYS
jgi:hypothetical protein